MADAADARNHLHQARAILSLRAALTLREAQRLAAGRREERAAIFAESMERSARDDARVLWDRARAPGTFDPLIADCAARASVARHEDWHAATRRAEAATAKRVGCSDALLLASRVEEHAEMRLVECRRRLRDIGDQAAERAADESAAHRRKWGLT